MMAFDLTIKSDYSLTEPPVKNLAELIFNRLEHRQEDSEIFLSHVDTQFTRLSLLEFRILVASLYKEFASHKISPGDTVLLACIPGNNEFFIAIVFAALASYGVRVLLPMFIETDLLEEWYMVTSCSAIIAPAMEIKSLSHHEKEKDIVDFLKNFSGRNNIKFLDLGSDLHIGEYFRNDNHNAVHQENHLIQDAMKNTGPGTEALIISTSGSSGKSKLVVYEQGAFILSCMSWHIAGLFDPDKLGGRGFTPLFTHTMSIRAFFNAVWTGNPLCLITTEWFQEKPESVRYFLRRMLPEHITGGPAVFNLMLNLMRIFPEMKGDLQKSFKTLVSSGAPFSPQTANEIQSAFGLKMHNAFGTTETQQILNSLLTKNDTTADSAALGAPLPGVVIGLNKCPGEKNLYRMFVQSPFGCSRIIEDNGEHILQDGVFDTGDIVQLSNSGLIRYHARENHDFIKDGFGVKIPLPFIRKFYRPILEQIAHLELFPVRNQPGMAALMFVQNQSLPPGKITNAQIIRDMAGRIRGINNQLRNSVEPFEFRHRHISRFAMVNAEVPRTGKGNVSQFKIRRNYEKLINAVVNPYSFLAGIEEVDTETISSHVFTRCLNPYIGNMLTALKMDYVYHRASRDSIFTYKNGKEIEILDLVGGYGTNLLGHNHPQLNTVMINFMNNNEIAISNQGSHQKYAAELATELNHLLGLQTGRDYRVIFGNSGAEAVEIALHHAAIEWRNILKKKQIEQRMRFAGDTSFSIEDIITHNNKILQKSPVHVITLKNGFHGNSCGARSLTGNEEKRLPFSNIIPINRIVVNPDSPDWHFHLEQQLNRAGTYIYRLEERDGKVESVKKFISTVIGAFCEPITGEGGIHVTNPDVIRVLSQYTFPLILDEIQCGLGRSGSIPTLSDTPADYYLFGKALGGNLEKISAVLIETNRYQKDFGRYYSGTFSNGEMAARVALKTISIIRQDHIAERATARGTKIFDTLQKIKQKYPQVIEQIGGKGLMRGIEFRDFSTSPNILLRLLSTLDLSGYIFASYLLNRHRVRVLPSLSTSRCLRLEPSAYISDAEIQHLAESIDDLAGRIQAFDLYSLFKPLMDNDPYEDNKGKPASPGLLYNFLDNPAPKAARVAFLGHFVHPHAELRMLESSFQNASDTGLRILFNRMQYLLEMKPVLLFAKNLFQGKIHFSFYSIPLDSAEMEKLHRTGKKMHIVEKIQHAVNLAAAKGAQVISLGGYNSILTNNGLALTEPDGCRISTGNTLTALSGITRLIHEIEGQNQNEEKCVLGIIGAGGNIGTIMAEIVSQRDDLFQKIILIDHHNHKLHTLEKTLRDVSAVPLEFTLNMSTLTQCRVITSVSNTNDPIIFPHHINSGGSVLIADLSIPSSVSAKVSAMPHVRIIPFTSFITLPGEADFIASSFTPPGSIFCCAAEAMLLGLEPVDCRVRGKITSQALETIAALAKKYHFLDKLEEGRSFKIKAF